MKIKNTDKLRYAFRAIVFKEMGDHFRNKRMLILFGIILLTCIGSLYTAISGLKNATPAEETESSFFFLKLFTLSDGTLPAYFVFISFLGPHWDV